MQAEDTAFCRYCSLGEGMWCSQGLKKKKKELKNAGYV